MLINYYQIESNLRRTADKGLISLLDQEQLQYLALKYFGIKDEYGDIIGYTCPYSGKEYYSYEDLILEHIIPVYSKGGTVLFNCIPTSKEVNGANQKGAKHLIKWWTSSKYWDELAPSRLEKLVNYMLEAYNIVFDEYTIEEVENSYMDIDISENILYEEDDLELSESKESKKLKKQASENSIHSYLGFILSCIETLEKHNIDTTEIHNNLSLLEQKDIFKDIERYQTFQNILQKIIISRIGDNNQSYLTYLLNFDIKKLMDSITLNNEQDIYNELDTRLKYIEQLLNQNNLSIIEYFKSLIDIPDIDLMNKDINNLTQEEIKIFLENIKLGIDSKINIFINMLNQGNSNILKQGNKEHLEGYPSINLSNFWNRHQDKIKPKLFIELKDNPEYDIARKTVLTYFNVNSYEELIAVQQLKFDEQINIYISMLNQGNSNILKQRNKETLEGYPSINLSRFWNRHQDKIKPKLFVELKDNPEYDMARQTVLTYLKVNSYEELLEKERKKKELKELKKMKKMLEAVDKSLDQEENIENRKRA